jgi:hypothetical protein
MKLNSLLNALGRFVPRPDLNNPPTSVGGIQDSLAAVCRPDLKNPPTPLGGISEFSHSLGSDRVPAAIALHPERRVSAARS